jgi:hypothetical protein
MGCGREPIQPLNYLVKEMDNGTYLFYADPKTEWQPSKVLTSFTKNLNDFQDENKHLEVSRWEIVEYRPGVGSSRSSNALVATKIIVFTRPRAKK